MAHLISDNNFTDAYVEALRQLLEPDLQKRISPFFLITEIKQPLNVTSTSENYKDFLNLRKDIHEEYEKREFGVASERKKGKKWIEDRINVVCPRNIGITAIPLNEPRNYSIEEKYWERLCGYAAGQKPREPLNQLRAVASRLKYIATTTKRGSTDNCLTCAVFDPIKDLYPILQNPKPHQMGRHPPPCLTLLDFKVENKKLHLFAMFRCQYFDTKAYGNWISLGVLLNRMCQESGLEPGKIVSLACKVTFSTKDAKDAREFLKFVQDVDKSRRRH